MTCQTGGLTPGALRTEIRVIQLMKIVGIDVSKTSITCCVVDSEAMPSDYRKFSGSYQPIGLCPTIDGIASLLTMGEVFILEPTGDYSKVWIDILKANDRAVYRVNPQRVKALQTYHGVMSKSDRYDAAFLALYGAENLGRPSAFLSDYAEDLRDAVLQHQFLSRMTGNYQRRLWQLLSREWPEVCVSSGGKRPKQSRKWMAPEPPTLWNYIATGEGRYRKAWASKQGSSVGAGVSIMSKTLASQICELERRQYDLEVRISELLESPEFAPYHTVFDRFGFASNTRASILSRIVPFDQFLGDDGKPIRARVPSKSGRMNRRDRSLGAFRLALGNGTTLYQSGQVKTEVAAGPRYARTAIYLHIKMMVVILRSRPNMQIPKYLAQHRAYYEALPPMPHPQAVSKVASKLVKDLYRELLASL
ncbi:MAG: transposase [Spirulina sp.]